MNWPIEEYAIADLFLDQYNIRTPISESDQNALIRDMFDNEDAMSIVRSIVKNGLFPDEFPIGVKENERVIIIEGNRRLAALKALNESSIVPKWQKKIDALKATPIPVMRITLAPSRDEAINHIANKHTIDYRRPWKPLRQAYFYQSQLDSGVTVEELIQEFPEHDIVRFVKMLEMHHLAKSMNINKQLFNKVHDERSFPITNLERLYNDKEVASFLGITFDKNGRVIGTIDKVEFEKAFTKIIEDIALGHVDSRNTNTIDERRRYLSDLDDRYRPDRSKPGRFGSNDFVEKKPEKRAPTKRKSRSRRMPKGLFYASDVPFQLSSTSLELMYRELKDLDVAVFPNAAHDFLRSFLECSLVFYLKEKNLYDSIQKSQNHNPRLSELLNFVIGGKCPSIDDPNLIDALKQVRENWSQPYSLARMNMINHNENWTSSENDVRSAWGKLEPLFRFLLNPEN